MPSLKSIRRAASRCLIAAVCASSLGSTIFADEPSLPPPRVPTGEVVQIVSTKTNVEVTERTAKVIEFKEWLTQVDGFDPKVINVIALDKNKLRIQALEQGVTTMIVTDRNKQVHTVEVFVSGDARLLQSVLNRAFPNSAIQATMLRGNAVLLRGWVTDAQQIASITELAQLYSPNVVNQIKVGGPQEVQLRVYNSTGSTINSGSWVRLAGQATSNNIPYIHYKKEWLLEMIFILFLNLLTSNGFVAIMLLLDVVFYTIKLFLSILFVILLAQNC